MAALDIVIPHVDGSAPGYEELCRRHTGDFVPCHVRDLGELRHVLRALDDHMEDVRVVLVVQSEGHVPAWLRRDSLRVVRHQDFIPAPHLPTFHWATIVAHLHLIPDLAERYVVWEDDVVLGGPCRASDFFDPDGRLRGGWETAPIVPGLERVLGTYQRNLAHTRALLNRRSSRRSTRFLFPHAPLAVNRADWAAFFDRFMVDPVFRDTVTRRARGDEHAAPTIDPTVAYANWIETDERGRAGAGRWGAVLRHLAGAALRGVSWPGAPRPLFGKYPVVNDLARMRANMRRLLRERALFINVNDEAYDAWPGQGLNPQSVDALHETLSRLHPHPSRFEA